MKKTAIKIVALAAVGALALAACGSADTGGGHLSWIIGIGIWAILAAMGGSNKRATASGASENDIARLIAHQ